MEKDKSLGRRLKKDKSFGRKLKRTKAWGEGWMAHWCWPPAGGALSPLDSSYLRTFLQTTFGEISSSFIKRYLVVTANLSLLYACWFVVLPDNISIKTLETISRSMRTFLQTILVHISWKNVSMCKSVTIEPFLKLHFCKNRKGDITWELLFNNNRISLNVGIIEGAGMFEHDPTEKKADPCFQTCLLICFSFKTCFTLV